MEAVIHKLENVNVDTDGQENNVILSNVDMIVETMEVVILLLVNALVLKELLEKNANMIIDLKMIMKQIIMVMIMENQKI